MKSKYSIYATILGLICLGASGKVFLLAKEKSTEATTLEVTLASSRQDLHRARELEKTVNQLIPLPPVGSVPVKAEERMIRAFLDLPRIIHELGIDALEVKSTTSPSEEGPFGSLAGPLPMFENIRQGELKLSVRFDDLASIRLLLDFVEKMGGYVKSGKIQESQAEFIVGFIGI